MSEYSEFPSLGATGRHKLYYPFKHIIPSQFLGNYWIQIHIDV